MKKAIAIGLTALALSCRGASAQSTAGSTPPLPMNLSGAPAQPVVSDNADRMAAWTVPPGGNSGFGGHLEGGFELLIIRPYFESNPALTTLNSTTSGITTTRQTSQVNFDYDYTANPKVWLGYVSDCGLGARVSWWHFDQASDSPTFSQTTPLPSSASVELITAFPLFGNFFSTGLITASIPSGLSSGVPTTLATTSNVKLNVLDFEATATWHADGFTVEGSAGVRYAHISQDYDAFLSQHNSGAGASSSTTLLAGHNFNGAGLMVGSEVRHGLGDFGLGLYANTRASVLFGNRHTSADLQTTETTSETTTSIDNSSYNSDHLGVLGIGECEFGLGYSRKLGDTLVFVRAGIDGQIWFGAGSATTETGILGFFGYTMSVGINY